MLTTKVMMFLKAVNDKEKEEEFIYLIMFLIEYAVFRSRSILSCLVNPDIDIKSIQHLFRFEEDRLNEKLERLNELTEEVTGSKMYNGDSGRELALEFFNEVYKKDIIK